MAKKGRKVGHECKTSGVVVEKMAEYIETDECIKACGIDRKAIGISSDTLFDRRVLNMLCSTACYHRCPNIIELYFNMAVGEGVFLPYRCETTFQSSPCHGRNFELWRCLCTCPSSCFARIFIKKASSCIFPWSLIAMHVAWCSSGMLVAKNFGGDL